MSRLLTDLRQYASVKSCHTFGEFHHLTTINNEQLIINNLENALIKIGHKNVEIKEIVPTIEDCFMDLTNNEKHTDDTDKTQINTDKNLRKSVKSASSAC
jgi:hypothetical protein